MVRIFNSINWCLQYVVVVVVIIIIIVVVVIIINNLEDNCEKRRVLETGRKRKCGTREEYSTCTSRDNL
jgi:L-asparagine transporter-like permease